MLGDSQTLDHETEDRKKVKPETKKALVWAFIIVIVICTVTGKASLLVGFFFIGAFLLWCFSVMGGSVKGINGSLDRLFNNKNDEE